MNQFAALLLLDEGRQCTLAEIQSNIKISTEEICGILKSLQDINLILYADGKYRVNVNFSSKRSKIKLTSTQNAEQKEDTKLTISSIDQDRRFYLQATIVRIMKAKKTLGHSELTQEIYSLCASKFNPTQSMLKECIENLIEKQFIERQDGEKGQYTYMA